MRTVDLYRYTDNDGDALSAEGIEAARELGERLTPRYDAIVSTGADRATQMAEILREALGPDAPRVTVQTGLRSVVEDRWRDAAKRAGGSEVEAIRRVDPELVERECVSLGTALRWIVDALPEGGRALVVGHSPTNEAAVLGLTGQRVQPLGKGEGVRVVQDGGRYTLQRL
jgi:broad specificity phosphatase PhoE